MDDVLLELTSAARREVTTSPAYDFHNADRIPAGVTLQYTWAGEGRLRRGKRDLPCQAGQALLMVEGDQTRYFYPSGGRIPWEFSWVNFRGGTPLVARLVREHGDIITLDPHGETVEWLTSITRLHESHGFRDRFETSDYLARLLGAMGREISRPSGPHGAPARAASGYLRDHHRRPLNIKEVATKFSLSREHFSRLFREETGQSPARYLRDLRLQSARHLLITTRLPAHEVAVRSGFGSVSHFCRAFKAAFGGSPLGLRADQTDPKPARGGDA